MAEKEIGVVTHYFGHIKVAAIKLSDALNVGETLHIKGHTTDLNTTVSSMQVNHQSVRSAKPGDAVGIVVPDHVREHDKVYKIVPD